MKKARSISTQADSRPGPDRAGRRAEVLAELTELGLEMARVFQAQAVKAAQAGNLDCAGKAEAGFNRTALGVRRAVALEARLQRQREEAAQQADDRRDRRREAADRRRRAVAKGIGTAIAAQPDADTRERLTADLWTLLAEGERIDADRPDTVLLIETLILRLGRELGLPRRALTDALGPEAKADRADPQGKAYSPATGSAARAFPPAEPPEEPVTESASYRCIPAADLGLPGDEPYLVRVDTGEVFDDDDNVIMRLAVPANPWRADGSAPVLSAGTVPAESVTPPEPDPPPPETDDERRRREHEERCRLFGLRPHPS